VEPALQVDISFSDEDPKQVLSILKGAGARDLKQSSERGLTGIEDVIVGVLVISALANVVIRLAPLWKCGIVVDARGTRILTTKECNLPNGTVLVISEDGIETRLNEPSEVQLKELLVR
jgi:hypothetical protein